MPNNNEISVDMALDIQDFEENLKKSEKLARDTWKKLDQELVLNMRLNIDDLEQKVAAAKKDLKKLDPESVEAVRLRLDIKQYKNNLTEARRQLNNYLNTWDKNLSRLQRKFDQVTDEIKLSREEMKKLWLSNREIAKVEKATEKLNQDFKKWVISQQKYRKELQKIRTDAKSTTSLFGKMWKAIVAAFAVQQIKEFFMLTSRIAISFESAFAWVNKTLDLTAQEFNDMKDGLRDLSKEIPLTVEELWWIAEVGWQLWVAKDDIIEFTRVAAWLWVATNLTAEQAATAFARIANVMNEPISQMDQMWSSLVDLWNNFATNESEILNFAERIAGAWEIAGLTSAEVLGISAAFTSVGIEAESGWTAVQKTLLTINNAVNDSWAELQKFAVVAWVSSQEFAELWETNAAQAFNKFVIWLKDSWDDAANILGELIWTDVRLARAFLSVSSAWDLMTRTIDTSTKAFEENEALAEEVNKRYDTMESKLKIQQNEWKLWWEVIWNDVTPALISINWFLLDTLPKTFFGLQIIMVAFFAFFKEKFFEAQKIAFWFVSAVQWTFNNMIWIFKDFWVNTWVFVRNVWKVFGDVPVLIKEALNKWIEQIEKFINFAWEGINKFAKKLWFEWDLVWWISLWRLDVKWQRSALESFKDINRQAARDQNKLLIEETRDFKNEKDRQIEINRDATRNFINWALEAWSQQTKIRKDAEKKRKEDIKQEVKDEVEKANKILKWLEDLEDDKAWLSKKAKEDKKEEEKAQKELNDKIKEWQDTVQDFYDEVSKWSERSQKEIDKLKEKVQDLNEELTETTEEKDIALAERKLEIIEEQKELEEELAELKKEERTSENLEKIKETEESIKKLKEENIKLEAVFDRETFDELQEYKNLSKTEQILADFEKAKEGIIKEKEEVLKSLAEQEKEYEKIDGIKRHLETEFTSFLKIETDARVAELERIKQAALAAAAAMRSAGIKTATLQSAWSATTEALNNVTIEQNNNFNAKLTRDDMKRISNDLAKWATNATTWNK